MTLNYLVRVTALALRLFSPNSIALQADYVTVVEDKPMSTKYRLPVFHSRRKLTHPAARSLCDRWATCWAMTTTIVMTMMQRRLAFSWSSDQPYHKKTRNSSKDEIANVNFFYDDIVHVLQNAIDSCINSATDQRGGYVLAKFSEITQCNGHYAVQGHLRSPILVPIKSSYTTFY